MRLAPFFLAPFILAACSQTSESVPKASDNIDQLPIKKTKIATPQFQTILDSANVSGSILIYSVRNKTYFSNDYNWVNKGFLPASTFKITNSIIALETGIMESESSVLVWNGEPRRMDIWEQDLTLKEAFHYSCVPCYQQVAREIGADRMNNYLDNLDFGHMVVDSTDIDLFWLEGDSKISQMEQLDFLERFYILELPISKRTTSIMKGLMVMDESSTYKVSGKTGWSIRNGHNNGWFVGYVETSNDTHFFAVNIIPDESFNMDFFPMIRTKVAYSAFRHLKIIE